MSRPRKLRQAWLLLLALSAATAFLASGHATLPAAATGVLLLVLAFAKGRIILDDYLGLRQAPAWRRGFALGLAIFLASLATLYLAAGISPGSSSSPWSHPPAPEAQPHPR